VPAKRCPTCKLVNEPAAERCDCGYSFVDGSSGAPRFAPPVRTKMSPGWWVVLGSVVLLVISLIAVKLGSLQGGGALGIIGVLGVGAGKIWMRIERD
jgi:hypothetical protein